MNRLVLSVALLWSTPALAYPYLISEQEAGSLTAATGAVCNPDPTPMPCQLPYNPVWIRVSDTQYCKFDSLCAAQSAGFEKAELELNTCEADNVTLTADLDACEADVTELTASLASCVSDSDATDAELAECQGDLEECSGDVDDLTAGLDLCTADLGAAHVTITTKDGEIVTLTADLSDCSADLADAQASLTAKDGQIATLEAEVGTLETENDSLETENDSLETEKASLEARIADLEDQVGETEVGECGCATPGFTGAPGAALLVALGLVRRRRATGEPTE